MNSAKPHSCLDNVIRARENTFDFRSILSSQVGTGLFVSALDRAKTGEQLIRLLGRYVQFNAIFGSGVAHLAGEIGARTYLFRDSTDPIPVFADRSIEVAASVFFAAIEEFGGGSSLARNTHRSLAQATIKGVGEYLGMTNAEVGALLRSDTGTTTAIEDVQAGYGLNRTLEDRHLFHGLGFHLGSEALADEEFCALDSYFQRHHSELVHFLMSKQVCISGHLCGAYNWIKLHTTAEAEHADAGATAVALALKYYAGPHSKSQIEQFILDGCSEFGAVQTKFMAGLLD